MMSMLLAQSVFLGIFFGSFDISVHSLFLSIFDEKMLARAYIVSGFSGIILTSLFTWLQTRMQFRNFAIINLIFITILTLFLWIGLISIPANWIIFFAFVMLGPLNILAILGFRGTTGRLFKQRPDKRLFRLVDVGLITGIIIICYTIPVLLSFNFATHNILLVSTISVMVAAIIQIMIGGRFRVVGVSDGKGAEREKTRESFVSHLTEDRYTRIIGLFIVLSVLAAFFVQYSFMAVTREQYPAEVDMARFLGIFTGSMMIFTLLVKLLVFSYLIRNYGLRICLVISPVLIAVFIVIAIGIGLSMGYTPGYVSGFLIFFMLLALIRFLSKSFKDSIESPSLKVIYQAIDEKLRYKVQSVMDGTVNEIAVLSSGLILTGLGALSFIKLIHFSWILLIVIFAWIIIALRLYSEYRKSIRKALETVGISDSEDNIPVEINSFKGRFYTDITLKTNYFNLITGDLSLPGKYDRKRYYKKIIEYSDSTNDINLIAVLKEIAADSSLDSDMRQQTSELLTRLKFISSGDLHKDGKISNAKKILAGSRLPQTTEILRLLKDKSVESKRMAIYMIGKFKLADMLPEVCECLGISGLESDATMVIRKFGSKAVDELISYYLASSGNIRTCVAILRLLGEMCTKESVGFIFSRIWSNRREIREYALKCLTGCEFKPQDDDRDRLHQYISDIIVILTWNLSAKICLEKNNDIFLIEEFKKEINRWNTFLFGILSITYDSGSIAKIRKNIENETIEGVASALEMIDILIDDSIKPILIPCLDVVPDEEKLKNLHQFYPVEVPQYDRLLEDIINRDYNLVSIWTKACALRNLPETEGDDLTESVVALLFSPEELLQEESARLIARSSHELYRLASQRISPETRIRLDRIVNGETNEMDLLFNKTRFLSKYFKLIPEEGLFELARNMIYIEDLDKGIPSIPYGYLIWALSSDNHGHEVFIHYADSLNDPAIISENRVSASYYILPLNTVEEYHNHYPERSVRIFEYIEKSSVR